jgi:hypothetical protein
MVGLSSQRNLRAKLILGVLVLNVSQAWAVDEPDLAREQRLHEIYKLYNSQPTKADVWSGAVDTGRIQTYSIQAGDNLWDLSETLFGDPNFWPKVWSLNSEKIENPHQITPGLNVQFTPGTTSDAPSLGLATLPPTTPPEASEEVASDLAEADPAGKDDVAEGALDPAEADFQKEILSRAQLPERKKSINASVIPPSIPIWAFTDVKGGLEFEARGVIRSFSASQEPLPYFLQSGPLQSAGQITEAEMGQTVASDYQYVYVRLNSPTPGKSYFVAKESGVVKDPVSGTQGRLIQVQGEVEVMEKVNSKDNLFRAMVTKTLNPVQVGSVLVEGSLPTFLPQEQGLGTGLARVIGGQPAPDRRMLDALSIVFLKGEGLQAGQTYPIFKRQTLRNNVSRVFENPRQIGQVKVIRTSDSLATAVILKSAEEIQVGDVTDPQMTRQ